MRALRLPNGNLQIPAEAHDPEESDGLTEIRPEHSEY